MAIFYTGYERQMAAWLKGRTDAYNLTYSVCVAKGCPQEWREDEANKAVEAYIRAFPEPEFPSDAD